MSALEKINGLEHLKKMATEHIKSEQYKAAIVYYQDILVSLPKILQTIDNEELMERAIKEFQIPTHKNLSLCYLKEQNFKKCIKECSNVLTIQPNNVKIIYRMGVAHLKENQLDQAEKYLKRGYILDPHEKQFMKGLEEIETKRRSIMQKKNERGMLQKIFHLLITLLIWPFYVYVWLWQLAFGKQDNKTKSK